MADEQQPEVVKVIRKLRHWKQRYDAKASFVWRRQTQWPDTSGDGKPELVTFPPGSLVPERVIKSMGPAKLRRFWESRRIELAEFEAPNVATGAAEATPSGTVSELVKADAPVEKRAVRKKKRARKKRAKAKPAVKRARGSASTSPAIAAQSAG